MQLVILFSVLAVSASARVANYEDYTFEQYLIDHPLQGKFSAGDLIIKRGLFADALAKVIAHNKKDLGWKAGMNQFSVLTASEKKAFNGRHKGVAQQSEKTHKFQKELPSDFKLSPVETLPRSVDWREKGVVSPVKDQGHCGSCWAFAATATIESHVALSSGLLYSLSPSQLAMCSPNPDSCGGTGGCNGATAEVAFEYLSTSKGHFQEFQYPYNSYSGTNYDCQEAAVSSMTSPKASIDGYVKLPVNNYTALMNAIATVGPIAVSVDASVWHNYESGVFSGCNQANPDIDHAVTLVGYGEENGQKYWLVRNSWSPTFGEKGYIKVARADYEEEVCGLDVTPADGNACAGQTEPQKVCGTCGILFDSSYPLLAKSL